jgi:hypothetical protein
MRATAERLDAADARPEPDDLRAGRRRRRWLIAGASAAAAAVLFVAYLAQARTVAATSEGSAQALQAWDMLRGNVLLRGWTLSDVTFYTTELPQYMLVELVRGLSGDVVHVAAALSYTVLVALAGLLAAGRPAGRDRLVSALVAVGIMLAPSLQPGVYLLLSAPDHIGTQVPLLLIWLLLDRPRPRWQAVAVAGLLLAWVQVADTLALYEGVIPLVVVGLVRAYRRRGPLRGQWYELSLVGAALASVAVARLALALIRHAGGFTARSLLVGITTSDDLATGLWHRVEGILAVFGADFFGQHLGVGLVIVAVHLVGLGLVGWAVAAGLRRFYIEDDLVVQLVLVSVVVVLAGYLLTNKSAVNEAVGLLPAGAVLAGRLLGARLLRAGLAPALMVVLACSVAILAFHATRPPARSADQRAAAWLAAHHLTYGLAGYWEAGTVTADSGGQVEVRPVRAYQRELVTTPWEIKSSWYDPRLHDASFVLWAPQPLCRNVCLSLTDLRAEFGPPAEVRRVGTYRVLVWRRNLLTGLSTRLWCGYAWVWATPAKPSVTPCR